jgi:hypothetical protein
MTTPTGSAKKSMSRSSSWSMTPTLFLSFR